MQPLPPFAVTLLQCGFVALCVVVGTGIVIGLYDKRISEPWSQTKNEATKFVMGRAGIAACVCVVLYRALIEPRTVFPEVYSPEIIVERSSVFTRSTTVLSWETVDPIYEDNSKAWCERDEQGRWRRAVDGE